MPKQLVRNQDLATDIQRLNLLTNPGFENWQRGNGPFTASGAWSADRWYLSLGSGSSMSVTPDTANAELGSGTSARIAYTHSNNSFFLQLLKTSEFKSLLGKNMTFSARIACNTPNAVQAT